MTTTPSTGRERDPRFPKPDRSDFIPNFTKTLENDVIDIGWAEGVVAHGAPFRMECWAQDQLTCLTIFCSSIGIEGMTKEQLANWIEAEGLVRYLKPETYHGASGKRITDPAGNRLWSINLVVGNEEDTLVESLPLQPYSK